MSVAQMAVSLYAANEGFLDDLEINKVRDFEDLGTYFFTNSHFWPLLPATCFNETFYRSLNSLLDLY
jgi:F0F1-type ATP synthase alpha subunit